MYYMIDSRMVLHVSAIDFCHLQEGVLRRIYTYYKEYQNKFTNIKHSVFSISTSFKICKGSLKKKEIYEVYKVQQN